MAHLTKLSFSAALVKEQESRLKRAREFVAQAKNQSVEEELAAEEEREKEEDVSVEEEEVEGSDEEWMDWRVQRGGKRGGGVCLVLSTHHAEEEDKATGTGFAEGSCSGFPAFREGVEIWQFHAGLCRDHPAVKKLLDCAARS